MFNRIKAMLHEEDGSQLIEFVAVLPYVAVTFLIGWQFLVAGHTFIVTINAAREGARALAVCNATPADAIAAATASVPRALRPVTTPSGGGSSVRVTVETTIPPIDIFPDVRERMPKARFTAEMRKESCR